jgi:hypothetical protein
LCTFFFVFMARLPLCAALLLAVFGARASRRPHTLLAANPLDVSSGDVPDVDREDLELRHFTQSLVMPNTTLPCREKRVSPEECPDIEYNMQGYVPATGKDYPVYLFVSGAGPWTNTIRNQPFDENLPEMTMVAAMARRGFASAISEFPMVMGPHLRCHALSTGTPCLMDHARQVFSWTGPNDRSSIGPLATLCRLGISDCSRGIALHGHSVGGLLANLAPRFAPVTGLLLWGAGSRLPYGFSCCGANSRNYSCCEEGNGYDAPLGELPVVAGSELPCLMYNETKPYLDRSRRLLIIATNDHEYGDCDLDMQEATGVYCNATDGWNPFGSIILGRRDSGYDCGNATRCIQNDGSGYIIPLWTDIGDRAVNNAHNFHTIVPGMADGRACFVPGMTDEDEMDEECRYVLNPEWVNSTAPWGLTPSIQWLAATATRPL